MNNILILDYDQWKCGGHSQNSLGSGLTKLLNSEGYMCCLGQFSLQFEVTEKEILHRTNPCDINKYIPLLNEKINRSENTEFSEKAVAINDTFKTTPLEKIEQLTSLCHRYDYELVVLNMPEKIKKMNLTKEQIIEEGWKLTTWINSNYRFVRPEANLLEDQYYIEMAITLNSRWNCTIKEVNGGVRFGDEILFHGTIQTIDDLRSVYKLIDIHSEFQIKEPNKNVKNCLEK